MNDPLVKQELRKERCLEYIKSSIKSIHFTMQCVKFNPAMLKHFILLHKLKFDTTIIFWSLAAFIYMFDRNYLWWFISLAERKQQSCINRNELVQAFCRHCAGILSRKCMNLWTSFAEPNLIIFGTILDLRILVLDFVSFESHFTILH